MRPRSRLVSKSTATVTATDEDYRLEGYKDLRRAKVTTNTLTELMHGAKRRNILSKRAYTHKLEVLKCNSHRAGNLYEQPSLKRVEISKMGNKLSLLHLDMNLQAITEIVLRHENPGGEKLPSDEKRNDYRYGSQTITSNNESPSCEHISNGQVHP